MHAKRISTPRLFTVAAFTLGLVLLLPTSSVLAWKNGQAGNASTNKAPECDSPPYSTHDWIADHALAILPDEEKAWLVPHKTLYLLGTEAPDNSKIPKTCKTPNTGYNDRRSGHSVEWKTDMSGMKKDKDRAARRAQEEYGKAIVAFQSDRPGDAAYYLGAMAHYVGDVSQYGHTYPNEKHHSDYEAWVGRRTKKFDHGVFESNLVPDGLKRRTPYTAVKRISKATKAGKGKILPALEMDGFYKDKKDPEKGPPYKDSIGHSLNLGVNELADVLHTFFLNVVSEED